MTTITASLVKELRERTGAGLMDCKKALADANGDIEAAIEIMRKSGQAKAAKKTSRVAAEGRIVINRSVDGKSAIIVEINCETDFVARDHNFIAFSEAVAKQGLALGIDSLEKLLTAPFENGKTIDQAREALVATIGENINIRRMLRLTSTGIVASYLHSNYRIGVLLSLSTADQELGKDIAMHIAASKPLTISPEELSQELLAKEKEIYLAQVQDSGKPKEIMEKMVTGRLQKFINESTLLNQPFVKDPEIKISSLLKKANAKILAFTRFEVGEGIEKKSVDFAREVMAQVEGK